MRPCYLLGIYWLFSLKSLAFFSLLFSCTLGKCFLVSWYFYQNLCNLTDRYSFKGYCCPWNSQQSPFVLQPSNPAWSHMTHSTSLCKHVHSRCLSCSQLLKVLDPCSVFSSKLSIPSCDTYSKEVYTVGGCSIFAHATKIITPKREWTREFK